jgi:segregation and condensation protein B
MGGGAAFWAARGVRIEPEVTEEEDLLEQPEPELEPEPEPQPEAAPESFVQAEAVVETEAEDEFELEVEADVEAEPVTEPEPEAEFAAEVQAAPAAPTPVPAPRPASEQETEFEAEPEPAATPAESATPLAGPLPGFPQQRTVDAEPAAFAVVDAAADTAAATGRDAADTDSDSDGDDTGSAEPAWQLSGELATLPPLKTCIEAILMVVDEPTSVVSLAQVLERPTAEVADALTELAEEYTVLGRGFELREVGLGNDGSHTGWRIYSRAVCAPVVERFVRDGQQAKLTQAALETLAVVAYRQPVSRSKVSAIRGVNCDGVMRTLLARGLVEEYGNDAETGAVLYQTTGYFLERMGLKSLDELPDLAPLLPGAAEADVEDFA